MEEKRGQPTTIDEYFSKFPQDLQHILIKLRAAIKESVPEAVEQVIKC